MAYKANNNTVVFQFCNWTLLVEVKQSLDLKTLLVEVKQSPYPNQLPGTPQALKTWAIVLMLLLLI